MNRVQKGFVMFAAVLVVACGNDEAGPNAGIAGQAGTATSTGGSLVFGAGGTVGAGTGGSMSTGGSVGGAVGTGGQGGTQPACPSGQIECNGTCLSPGMSSGNCTALVQTNGANAMALDANDVYLAQGNTINRTPKSGGPLTKVTDTQEGTAGVAVNSTHVFWVENGPSTYSVYAMPKSSGTSVAIATHSDRISSLRANESRVFFYKEHFGAPADVVSVTTDGQSPLLYGTSDTAHDSIVLDDPNLYWGDSPFSQSASVWMSAQASPTARQVATAESVYYPVLGESSVFFYDSLGGRLYQAPKSGGTATPLLTPPSLRRYDPYLFGDGSHVYWFSTDGIWRVALDGKNPASFATTGEVPAGLAKADASGVYVSVAFFVLKLAL